LSASQTSEQNRQNQTDGSETIEPSQEQEDTYHNKPKRHSIPLKYVFILTAKGAYHVGAPFYHNKNRSKKYV
jgi:hypothetical protein